MTPSEANEITDSVGNVYQEGAIVRMFHFSTRRKKYYMYKQVTEVDLAKRQVGFCHLPVKRQVATDFKFSKERCEEETVIVLFYYKDSRELKRNPKMRD